MDSIIEKKRGLKKRHIPYLAGGFFLLSAICWLIFGEHTMRLNVEEKKLDICAVTRAEFNDYIRINGQVQPFHIIHLSALEGGMVIEKCVEEGAMVREGAVIVRLRNPMLNLNILDSEAQLAEKQNFLRNTQVEMERERLNLKKENLQLDMDVQRKRRKYEQYRQLYAENLVSREDYLQSKEDYEFADTQRLLVIERQCQDSIYRGIQIAQMEESLHNIRRNLELIRKRVNNLNVTAPADGQLGLLDVEIGQSVNSGERLGQINVLSDYKVEALIDEHYIDRVKAGLEAKFERQDKSFTLRVRKVYPEVRDKQFKTDFVFEGERPNNMRTGQTYYVHLQLGEPSQAVLIPKGSFYQTTGGQWIYVVSPDGKRAVRRSIVIGRQNPKFYEVLSGLEPGERVIVSGYDRFGESQELSLR